MDNTRALAPDSANEEKEKRWRQLPGLLPGDHCDSVAAEAILVGTPSMVRYHHRFPGRPIQAFHKLKKLSLLAARSKLSDEVEDLARSWMGRLAGIAGLALSAACCTGAASARNRHALTLILFVGLTHGHGPPVGVFRAQGSIRA